VTPLPGIGHFELATQRIDSGVVARAVRWKQDQLVNHEWAAKKFDHAALEKDEKPTLIYHYALARLLIDAAV